MKTKNGGGKIKRFTFVQTPVEGKVAAVYVRVSSEEFKRGIDGKERRMSPQVQTADGKEFAEKHGWSVKVFDGDCNISGMEDIADRPAMQAMIADIEAGKIHTVLCRMTDRLFRNVAEETFFIHRVCLPAGVNIKAWNDPSVDISNSMSRAMMQFKSAQNQDAPIQSAISSMQSKDAAAKNGTLRTVPPFGYGIMEMDGIRKPYLKEKEVAIVQEIFRRYVKGEGVRSIHQDFCKRGVMAKHGQPFHTSNMVRCIHNPIYKGTLIWNGVETATPYPAIIDPVLWDKANKISVSRHVSASRKARNGTHLLTGLLQCGYCHDAIAKGKTHVEGHKLFENYLFSVNKTTKGGTKPRNYAVYRCQSKFKGIASTCPESIGMSAERLEDLAVSLAKTSIVEEFAKTLGNGEAEAKQLAADLATAKADLEEIPVKLKRMAQRNIARLISDDIFDAAAAKAKSETVRLNNLIVELNGKLGSTNKAEILKVAESLKGWKRLTLAQQKDGLSQFFKKFLLYKDHIEIHFSIGCSMKFPVIKDRNNAYVFDLSLPKGKKVLLPEIPPENEVGGAYDQPLWVKP
jgi:DNA invertase Pin-like site-specific DNA recombinase